MLNPDTNTVMLIDDSEIDNFVNSRIIKKSGLTLEPIIKQSARAALEHLTHCEDTGNKLPNIIFLDIHMPEMNGFEFLEEFGNSFDHLKDHISIFLLSSTLDPKDIKRGTENPYIRRILNKPLTLEQLEIVIEAVSLNPKSI